MAYPTNQSVAKAIQARLHTISGLRTSYVEPLAVQALPLAFVGPPADVGFHAGTSGHGRIPSNWTVTVVVSKAEERSGQQKLMAFMDLWGASSIHQAIEGDRTLGGIVDDCVCDDATFDSEIDIAGIDYYGAVFNLRVIVPGS